MGQAVSPANRLQPEPWQAKPPHPGLRSTSQAATSSLPGQEALHVRWCWTSGALCGACGDPYGTEIDGRPRVRTRNTRSIASAVDSDHQRVAIESARSDLQRADDPRRGGSNHWRPGGALWAHGDKTRAPAAAARSTAISNGLSAISFNSSVERPVQLVAHSSSIPLPAKVSSAVRTLRPFNCKYFDGNSAST